MDRTKVRKPRGGRRVPPATESIRRATDEFLRHFRGRLAASLGVARGIARADTSQGLRGQIRYWDHAIRTIDWLLAMNCQRRRDG